jgi:hypothetical protein
MPEMKLFSMFSGKWNVLLRMPGFASFSKA